MQLLPEQQKDPQVLARLMIPSTKVGRFAWITSRRFNAAQPRPISRYNRQFQSCGPGELNST